jgi:hypothetical protein
MVGKAAVVNAPASIPLKRGPKPTSYPSVAVIERIVRGAKRAGLDVGGFDALPDGTVRIFTAESAARGTLFDELDQAGKL